MKGREERFIRDVNHCVSKRLASTPNIGYIAFEDLTYIRRQARKGTSTGRRRRNMLNQWSFSQLQEFTTYKAVRNNIRILMVDPSYTSQRCNRCGYVDQRSPEHPRQGHQKPPRGTGEDTHPRIDPGTGRQSTGPMDGTPMTTSTRKGWQSHGSHAHVQTAMLVIAVVDQSIGVP